MQRFRLSWAMATLSMLGLTATDTQAQEPPPQATFNVNTVADLIDDNAGNGICHTSANNCSLRAAIMEANHLTTPDLIVTINVPIGTFRLTRAPGTGADELDGDLDLLVSLGSGQLVIINGAGATRTIIDANHSDRALDIAPTRSAVITHLTIRNGDRDSGGGINISSGALTIRDCVIEANLAENSGGGIYNGGGTLNITRSIIRSNNAGDDGGGMYLSGPTTIRDSTVSGNGANEGGAMRNSDLVSVVNSTISQNYAYGDGGGIYNTDATFLYNSTVIDNDADHDQDEDGGIGGGIYSRSGRTVGVVNSLVVDNTLGNTFVYNDCYGPLTAYGLSLFSDVSGCEPSGAWNTVPQGTIGPLQNNGGPTLTHAPHADSIAIDSTNDSLGCVDQSGALLMTDQRGLPRVAGPRCDVGALEYAAENLFRNSFE